MLLTTSFYNSIYGNPDSITFSPTSYSRYNVHFRYDTSQRLTDFYSVYSPGLFYEWNRYVYDVNGVQTHDTLYQYGYITTGGPVSPTYWWLINNTYDLQNRVSSITKTRLIPNNGNQSVTPYNYDSNGNLPWSHLPNVFDTATSTQSTHPV